MGVLSDLVVANEEQRVAARKWAATEEFALDRWSANEVASAFDGIASLARKAEAAGHSLFLWMCL